MPAWNSLDLILACFVLFATLNGLRHGLLAQLVSVIPWWGAIVLGVMLSPLLIKPLTPYVAPQLAPLIAGVVGTSLVFGLLTFGVSAVNTLLKKTPLLWLSPVLGAILGALYALGWVGVFVLACSFKPLAKMAWVQHSVVVQKGLALLTKLTYWELIRGKRHSWFGWLSLKPLRSWH